MNPVVYVDYREKASQVPFILRDLGVLVRFRNLTVGDYLVSDRLAIERKTISDFIKSVFEGRIFDQINRLLESYEKPVIVVEGIQRWPFEKENVQRAFWGAIASICVDKGMPVFFTTDPHQTARLIYVLAKREQEKTRRHIEIRHKPKMLSLKEQQIYVVAGLPGIGDKLAVKLLKRFKTVRNIFTASTGELSQVIGFKRALKVKELLDAEFKEGEETRKPSSLRFPS